MAQKSGASFTVVVSSHLAELSTWLLEFLQLFLTFDLLYSGFLYDVKEAVWLCEWTFRLIGDCFTFRKGFYFYFIILDEVYVRTWGFSTWTCWVALGKWWLLWALVASIVLPILFYNQITKKTPKKKNSVYVVKKLLYLTEKAIYFLWAIYYAFLKYYCGYGDRRCENALYITDYMIYITHN